MAVIAEIIDHNRALIDGPVSGVPRQAFAYRHLILTPYTISSLPRAAGTGAIKKAFEKSEVSAKWEASSWAKKLAARDQRKKANDFERFEIGLLKRQKRDLVRILFIIPENCVIKSWTNVVVIPFTDLGLFV